MPVPAPSDRRFRRVRVSPRRRSVWHRSGRRLAIGLLGLAAAGVACAALVQLAARSPALTVRSIAIAGNARVSAAEIRAMLRGLEGSNLLAVDLDAWKTRLLARPWIADADLRRVFPDGVRVVVRERRAAAIGRVGGTLYAVDQAGTIIAALEPGDVTRDLPVVDGLASDADGALHTDAARARLMGRLLAALRPHPDLYAAVSQIDVTDARNAVVLLTGDTALVQLGDREFAERLQTYVDVAPRLREDTPDIDSVDMRYGAQLIVSPDRPAGGGAGRRRRG